MPISRYDLVAVGAAPTLLMKVDNSILNETYTVWGMTLANVAGADCTVSIYLINRKKEQVFVFKDIALPAENMIGLGEDAFNFVLEPGDELYVYSSGAVDVTLTVRNYV